MYDENFYGSPEKHGLEIVGEVDAGGGYDFEKFVVWTDGRRLYYATDSGCSCPTPFEDIDTVSDLVNSPKAGVLKALDEWNNALEYKESTVGLRAKIDAWRPGKKIKVAA